MKQARLDVELSCVVWYYCGEKAQSNRVSI